MSEVTRILEAIGHGDKQAASDLLPLVYEELRQLAARRLSLERPGHTLQATALVHEAWLRLVGPEESQWDGRGHFFAAAAEAMRRILVENVRRKNRLRHGGGLQRVDLDEVELVCGMPSEDLLAVNPLCSCFAFRSEGAGLLSSPHRESSPAPDETHPPTLAPRAAEHQQLSDSGRKDVSTAGARLRGATRGAGVGGMNTAETESADAGQAARTAC